MSKNHEKAPSVEETEFGGTSVSQRRRVIYFANGDILEQDSDGEEAAPQNEPFSGPDNTAPVSWREYSWSLWMKAGKKSLQTCDFIGEKLANLIGLNMAKYQYAIDEFHRDMTEGLMHGDTEGAPCVDEGAEAIQVSPGKSAEYGATGSLRAPGLQASPNGVEHNRRNTGSQNKGYQED